MKQGIFEAFAIECIERLRDQENTIELVTQCMNAIKEIHNHYYDQSQLLTLFSHSDDFQKQTILKITQFIIDTVEYRKSKNLLQGYELNTILEVVCKSIKAYEEKYSIMPFIEEAIYVLADKLIMLGACATFSMDGMGINIERLLLHNKYMDKGNNLINKFKFLVDNSLSSKEYQYFLKGILHSLPTIDNAVLHETDGRGNNALLYASDLFNRLLNESFEGEEENVPLLTEIIEKMLQQGIYFLPMRDPSVVNYVKIHKQNNEELLPVPPDWPKGLFHLQCALEWIVKQRDKTNYKKRTLAHSKQELAILNNEIKKLQEKNKLSFDVKKWINNDLYDDWWKILGLLKQLDFQGLYYSDQKELRKIIINLADQFILNGASGKYNISYKNKLLWPLHFELDAMQDNAVNRPYLHNFIWHIFNKFKSGQKHQSLIVKSKVQNITSWFIEKMDGPELLKNNDNGESAFHELIYQIIHFIKSKEFSLLEQFIVLNECKKVIAGFIENGANIYAQPEKVKSIIKLASDIPELSQFIITTFNNQFKSTPTPLVLIMDECGVPSELANIITHLAWGDDNFVPAYAKPKPVIITPAVQKAPAKSSIPTIEERDNVTISPAYQSKKKRKLVK